jgi:hypothetical protein
MDENDFVLGQLFMQQLTASITPYDVLAENSAYVA